MANAIKTMRECETAGTTDLPEFAEAQDTFDANNGYALEPKAKKDPRRPRLQARSSQRASQHLLWWLGHAC